MRSLLLRPQLLKGLTGKILRAKCGEEKYQCWLDDQCRTLSHELNALDPEARCSVRELFDGDCWLDYGEGWYASGDCTTDGCTGYSSRSAAEDACVAQGTNCDAIYRDCGTTWYTRTGSSMHHSGCDAAAEKVTPSTEQQRLMQALETNDAFANVMQCERDWEESDHICLSDADCVVGEVCERIISRCVPDAETETCQDDKYGLVAEVSQHSHDPCMFMSRHRNNFGTGLCDARMGPDSRFELNPSPVLTRDSDWYPDTCLGICRHGSGNGCGSDPEMNNCCWDGRAVWGEFWDVCPDGDCSGIDTSTACVCPEEACDAPAQTTTGIPGVGLNVRGRDICPARCGECEWEGEYGAKCTENSDCPAEQFCATSCWSGDCQDGSWDAVCQPCDYLLQPWDSLDNDYGHCPTPPPPPMPSKCMVFDATVAEGCRVVPHQQHEELNATECDFNPVNSTTVAECLESGNVGFHFQAYRSNSQPHFDNFMSSHLAATFADDVWFDGWTPAFEDTSFTDDVWFESENDFINKAPGGFSDRNSYVMRWRGTMTVETGGEYGFRTSSDDGSLLYISEVGEDAPASCPEPPAFEEPAGFVATCGSLELVDEGHVVHSDLQNNQYCTWTVECSDPTYSPRLSFSSFDTERNFDFLNVHDGSVDGPRLARLDGTLGTAASSGDFVGDVVGLSPTMEIYYTSDGSVNRAGFQASVVCCPLPLHLQPVVNNDGLHSRQERVGTYALTAGTVYSIVIVHYAQEGTNSLEVSWRPPNDDSSAGQPASATWSRFGAVTSAGSPSVAHINNLAGCVCRLSAGFGRCSYVEPYAGTDDWELDPSCRASDASLAACVPEYELHWPEDTNGDGNQECGCTAGGYTVSTHERQRRCTYTPGDGTQGPTCTGSLQICEGTGGCRDIDCEMGPVECEFECWPPPGVCLSSGQADTMCGNNANCDRTYFCSACQEACDRPAVSTELPGFEGRCLGICGAGGNDNNGACGTDESRNCCHDGSRVIYGEFAAFAAEVGSMHHDRACECPMDICDAAAEIPVDQTQEQCVEQCYMEGGPCDDACQACQEREWMQGTYEGCWEQSWQGQPGACLQYSEGVCISHYTGAPMCMDTASECTRELPYCNPEGCAEGMCTCMPVPNPPIFDNVHCSSSCIEGDCDACCGCDCGAEWAASDMDIPAAASIACGRNTTTACAGTQPDFLPFSYADFADIVDINWGSFTPEVVSQTCASPSSTYPDGLGPARAATTEAECERWAQLSGGTYGGLLPADIYGCYRPATHVPLQSAEKGVYADHDPQAPWYFSNTGNGAPSTYTGGQCSAVCSVPPQCTDALSALGGGSDCCGCLTNAGTCPEACESLPDECQTAWLCPGVCDVPDACTERSCAFGCLSIEAYGDSWCEDRSWNDPAEWDAGLGAEQCGSYRLACSTSSTTLSGQPLAPTQYDCLCAEVGGRTCDLLQATVRIFATAVSVQSARFHLSTATC